MSRQGTYPHLMIVKEKYATLYYLINSPEELHAVSLKILTRRNDEGYWYPDKSHEYADEERELRSAMANLAAGGHGEGFTAYDTLKLRLASAAMAHRDEERLNRQRDEIDAAIATGDGRAAYRVLMDRRDYEYEGFESEAFS